MGARIVALSVGVCVMCLGAVFPASAQYKAEGAREPATVKEAPAPRARAVARPRQPAITGQQTEEGAAAVTPSDQCQWLGKRIVSLLIRDDAVAANDFIPFYNRFGCSEPLLADAFGCLAASTDLAETNGLAEQVDACWRDPTSRVSASEAKKADAAEKPAAAAGGEKPETAAVPVKGYKSEKPDPQPKPEPQPRPAKPGEPANNPS